MLSLRNKPSPFVILIIIVVLGYWQISFGVYGLKWDVIDVVLPFRYFFSECIKSGYFPFWDPYQQTGTPFYADLQAPTYYPELIITSMFGGYGVYTMHVLFVVYLGIAATGMYKLSFYFNKSRGASLIAGLSYSFSGYIVGHGQHFFLLVGAAWIPFVILSYIRLNQNREIIDSLKTGIFVFLMLTGAYQALSIAMAYLLLLIFIYSLIKTLVEKNLQGALQIIKLNLFFFFILLLLCLPLLASTLEIISSVGRLNDGVDLKRALALGQPYTSFISFVAPFSTLKYNELFGNADFSLINHYFGTVPLLFFIASLFRKHSILEYLILGFGLVIFSMSFDFLPVRGFMYKNAPFMDLFLCAAYIRVYGLLALILFSANYFACFEKNITCHKNKIIALSSILLIALGYLVVVSLCNFSSKDFKHLFHSGGVGPFLKNMSFYQNLLVQSIFHFMVIAGLIAIIVCHKKIRHPGAFVFLLSLGEIVAATQLNMNVTVIDMQHKPRDMQEDLSLCPESFPIPVDGKIIFNDQQNAFFPPFWRNTYIFTKQVAFGAFSSFKLDTYKKIDERPKLKDAVLNNHLFYFSDTIAPLSKFLNGTDTVAGLPALLYFSDQDYGTLSGANAKTCSADIIKVLDFSPNSATVETNTGHAQFLTMLQTNYKGWKAFVDDKPTQIYTSNFNYRTIFLPGGKHVVRYEYKNNKVLVLYIVSNVMFVICILFLLGRCLYHKNSKNKIYIYIPLALIILLTLLATTNFSQKKKYHTVSQYYNERFEKQDAVFCIEQDFEGATSNYDSVTVFSGKKSFVVDPGIEFLPIMELVQEDNKIKKGTLMATAKIYSESYCKALIVSDIRGQWHAAKIEKQIEGLEQWNEVRYVRNVPEMDNGEVLKLYLWNPGKSSFIIDDISVELFD